MAGLMDLTVGDLMTTAVLTVKPTDRVASAWREMKEGDIRHLPVLNDKGAVVGILSDRDLLRALGEGWEERPVSDCMTSEVLVVRPQTSAREATMLMLEYKVSSVPVVDDAGELVGLVTETDFLSALHRVLGGDQLER
jgi:CBS domain-containing protein